MDNMTSERVDAEGISNIAKGAKRFLPQRSFQPETEQVISMRSKEDLEVWEKLDDTIMGGKSGSFLQVEFKELSKTIHNCQSQGYMHLSSCKMRGSWYSTSMVSSLFAFMQKTHGPAYLPYSVSHYGVTVASTSLADWRAVAVVDCCFITEYVQLMVNKLAAATASSWFISHQPQNPEHHSMTATQPARC